MSYLDDSDSGMTRFDLNHGETLEIEMVGAKSFACRIPEILVELIVCTDFVNRRYIETVGKPVVFLVFM
jgi:hypothetical protein